MSAPEFYAGRLADLVAVAWLDGLDDELGDYAIVRQNFVDEPGGTAALVRLADGAYTILRPTDPHADARLDVIVDPSSAELARHGWDGDRESREER